MCIRRPVTWTSGVYISVRLASRAAGSTLPFSWRSLSQRSQSSAAGVGAGGQGLAQPGCAVADADVAVSADGVGELDEPAVLLGDLEADQHPRRHHPGRRWEVLGHLCSSPCVGGSVLAVQLEPGAGSTWAGGRACSRWRCR